MTIRFSIFACAAFWLVCFGLPADAGQRWHREHNHWRAAHQAVYELEHDIALLEADPHVDDGYRAPVIAHESVEIRRLRAALPPARWRWTSPCCYSRRPIYIR